MLKLRDHRAYWCGTRLELTVAEFKALSCLFEQAGTDLTYRQIYDAVRGEGYSAGDGPEGCRVAVRSMIKRIRKKFRDVDPAFDGIENYESFGYCWRELAKAAAVLREVG